MKKSINLLSAILADMLGDCIMHRFLRTINASVRFYTAFRMHLHPDIRRNISSEF